MVCINNVHYVRALDFNSKHRNAAINEYIFVSRLYQLYV